MLRQSRQMLGLLVSLAASGSVLAQPPVALPLQQIMLNMGKANETAVRKEAMRETNLKVWPLFSSNPPKTPFFRNFEGHFIPRLDTTQLAIFSDDGCNVLVDDVTPGKKQDAIKNPVHNMLSRGQHLPALSQSFHVLQLRDSQGAKLNWKQGHIYRIRVSYSNIWHTDRKDVDGCTLFAYEGGGRLLPHGLNLGN